MRILIQDRALVSGWGERGPSLGLVVFVEAGPRSPALMLALVLDCDTVVVANLH